MMKHLVLLGLIWFSASVQGATTAPAATPPKVALSVDMRGFGYHLGDVIRQTVHLPLAKGQTLDAQSLPLPGPVKPWLDLRAVAYQTNGQRLTLTLDWQVFATVEQAQLLYLPAFKVSLRQPAQGIFVPAHAFYHSPVLGDQVHDIARLPTLAALPYPLAGWQWLTWGCLLASVLFGLLALWLRDALPWLPWQPGPLLQVLRTQRQHPDSHVTERAVYRALCLTAAQTLHTDNLALLWTKAPWLLPLRADIEHFVLAYLQQQYGYQPLSGAAPASATVTIDWLPQAAILERLQRRRRS